MEDGDEIDDGILEQESENEDEKVFHKSQKKEEARRKKCCPTQRIDELSTPNKRIFLALWNDHAHHLPKDKLKNLKQILQQLYAMTPEETAKYFAELRAEAEAAAMRRKIKMKLRRYLMEKHHEKQKARAYKLFKKLLKCGIAYAAQNPIPPVISVRLRYLSDIILEQLCDLRKVGIPNRGPGNTDKLGYFLISVADWMAIAVERVYFAAQSSINEMIADHHEFQQANDVTMEVPQTFDEFEPPGASTPQRLSLNVRPGQSTTPKKMSLDKTVAQTPPLAASTPKRLSQDLFNTTYVHAPTIAINKKLPKMPFYTFDHMKTIMSKSESMNATTKLEMPYDSRQTSYQNSKRSNSSFKKSPKNKKLSKTKHRTFHPPVA